MLVSLNASSFYSFPCTPFFYVCVRLFCVSFFVFFVFLFLPFEYCFPLLTCAVLDLFLLSFFFPSYIYLALLSLTCEIVLCFFLCPLDLRFLLFAFLSFNALCSLFLSIFFFSCFLFLHFLVSPLHSFLLICVSELYFISFVFCSSTFIITLPFNFLRTTLSHFSCLSFPFLIYSAAFLPCNLQRNSNINTARHTCTGL